MFLTLSSVLLLGIAVQVHLATTSTVSLVLTTPASIDLIDLNEEEGAVVIDDAKSNNDYNSTSSSNVTKGSDNNDEDNDKQQQISVFYNVFTDSVNDVPTVKKMVEEQLSNLRPYHKVLVRSIGVPLRIEIQRCSNMMRKDGSRRRFDCYGSFARITQMTKLSTSIPRALSILTMTMICCGDF